MPIQTPSSNDSRRCDDHDALQALIAENLAPDTSDSRDW
jgi:hypothetical protein